MVRKQAEGLRIAMEMECRGQNLYMRARQFTDDPELTFLLKELEEEEKLHYALFSGMLAALGEEILSPEENALAAAKAANFFFPGGLMQVVMDGALSSPVKILEEAIRTEQDSIAFYTQLLAHLTEAEDKETVYGIVREEEGHLHTLIERKKSYL